MTFNVEVSSEAKSLRLMGLHNQCDVFFSFFLIILQNVYSARTLLYFRVLLFLVVS